MKLKSSGANWPSFFNACTSWQNAYCREHTKIRFWAVHWLVSLRTFYRQILCIRSTKDHSQTKHQNIYYVICKPSPEPCAWNVVGVVPPSCLGKLCMCEHTSHKPIPSGEAWHDHQRWVGSSLSLAIPSPPHWSQSWRSLTWSSCELWRAHHPRASDL